MRFGVVHSVALRRVDQQVITKWTVSLMNAEVEQQRWENMHQ